MFHRAGLLARCATLIATSSLPLLVAGCALPSVPGAHVRPPPQQGTTALGAAGRADAAAVPADRFMHSVAVRDGALGWRQLCPQLQKVVTQDTMRSQADGQKAAEAGHVARIRVDFVGSRPLRPEGQVRFYMLTAVTADGSEATRLYIVRTLRAGCVDGVQVDDLS